MPNLRQVEEFFDLGTGRSGATLGDALRVLTSDGPALGRANLAGVNFILSRTWLHGPSDRQPL
jgi:hypothetical protein